MPVELVRVHYLGDTEMKVTGPETRKRYSFTSEQPYGYVWKDDLSKLVPERQILGSPLFEVSERGK